MCRSFLENDLNMASSDSTTEFIRAALVVIMASIFSSSVPFGDELEDLDASCLADAVAAVSCLAFPCIVILQQS